MLYNDRSKIEVSLQNVLGRDAVATLDNPTAADLSAALKSAPERSGLLIVYSGHGIEQPSDAGFPQSAICLKAGDREPDGGTLGTPVGVAQLLEWIRDRRLSWASIILSACRSSYVDVSEQKGPVSVLSISPEDVREWAPYANEERQMTHVGWALASALDTKSALDVNCDGWVSDRELFDAMSGALRQEIPFVARSAIMPRLRRQAGAPIQLWRTDDATPDCAMLRTYAHAALRGELVQQLDRRKGGELPSGSSVDYFYLQDHVAHAACARTGPPDDSRPRLVEICTKLAVAGFKPLLINGDEGVGSCDGSGGCVPRVVSSVARLVDFADVYYVHLEADWIHVDRVRDERRIVSRRDHLEAADMPRRYSVNARWANGDFVAWFSGEVPETTRLASEELSNGLQQPGRIVAVCANSEGQCFFVPASPSLASASRGGHHANE